MADEKAAEKTEGTTRIIGRRRVPRAGLTHAAPFLELVIQLRGNKPFVPRGLHRFSSFQESQEWSLKMMARSSRDPRP